MQSDNHLRRRAGRKKPQAHPEAMEAGSPRFRVDALAGFAVAFGLFLGLAVIKFANPVVLESKIAAPVSLSQYWSFAWPPEWSLWLLVPLVTAGGWLAFRSHLRWPASRSLWVLPAAWFGWQILSAAGSVDESLSATTLWQFGGCLACYFLGAIVVGANHRLRLLLIGLFAAFAFCLVRAVDQRLFEFPQERQFLMESEREGWTNVPPDLFLEMQQDGVVIATNGTIVANPAILAKYAKGRVHGTMVYPNALAGIVLLLFPASLVLAFHSTRRFRQPTRVMVIALTLFLGGAGMFWTGSKSGWLIALAIAGVSLFRLPWAMKAKWAVLILMMLGGLALFGIRFRTYFAAGATSVGARFDYWRAAVQNTAAHPVLGSGPGTFQRPYSLLKSPDAEMARLAHNDYLEQFSDSGVLGGLFYGSWIVWLLLNLGWCAWRNPDLLYFGLFLGLFGWFLQGLVEFGLYIPALAWAAFALSGCLLSTAGNPFDKGKGSN